MSKCKVAKQLYRNHTSALVFFCKSAAYFHSTFSQEYLWVTASEFPKIVYESFFVWCQVATTLDPSCLKSSLLSSTKSLFHVLL